MVDKNNYIAKSDDGTKLADHSILVQQISEIYINKLYPNLDKNIRFIVKITTLLHDLLKTQKSFQDYCNGKTEYELQKFHHNELGWAFLMTYLNPDFIKQGIDRTMRYELAIDLICAAIFYHHGNGINIHNKPKLVDILSLIPKTDINNALNFGDELINNFDFGFNIKNIFISRDEKLYVQKINTPSFYEFNDYSDDGKNIYSDLHIVYEILIASDRLASQYKSVDNISEIIDNIVNSSCNKTIDLDRISKGGFNVERFNQQSRIVSDMKKTSVVKAQAGFGKTMISLIAGLESGKKIVWVCPTISTTQSVFSVIINTSEKLDLDLSIQTYYSGGIKDNTHSLKDFHSDVIVVNIDGFLSTTYKQSDYIKNIIIGNSFVVFDEFQDFKTETALFPVFVSLLNQRHYYGKEKTLLISATPLDLGYLMRSNDEFIVLPNKEEHYQTTNKNKKYKLKFISDFQEVPNKNNLIFFNGTVGNTQEVFKNYSGSYIIHGKFFVDVKKNKINELITFNGEDNHPNRINWVSTTSLAQTSLDISFNKTVIALSSPDLFMQGIGRCNRYGEYDDSIIYVLKYLNNSSHKGYIKTVHDYDIYILFHKFLIKNINEDNTYHINDLYKLYNEFNNKNVQELRLYQNKLLNNSIERCELINVRKSGKTKDHKIVAGSNPLRFSGKGEKFYIVFDKSTNRYINECFNQIIYNNIDDCFGFEINNNKKYIRDCVNEMEILTKCEKNEFDYSEILKAIKGSKIKTSTRLHEYLGNTNKTPIIVIDRYTPKRASYYDHDIGVEILKEK